MFLFHRWQYHRDLPRSTCAFLKPVTELLRKTTAEESRPHYTRSNWKCVSNLILPFLKSGSHCLKPFCNTHVPPVFLALPQRKFLSRNSNLVWFFTGQLTEECSRDGRGSASWDRRYELFRDWALEPDHSGGEFRLSGLWWGSGRKVCNCCCLDFFCKKGQTRILKLLWKVNKITNAECLI